MLNLFFCAGERLPPKLVRIALKDTSKVSSVAAPRECYEPENERNCTEPVRKRMSDDSIELTDTELDYIYFGDETDSDDGRRFGRRLYLFILKNLAWLEFLKVFQSEIFCITKCGGFFLTETFILNLCSFNIAENANNVETAF